MELPCVKGERILLTDNCSQTFSGVVKSVNADLGRILLTDIVQFPGRKSIVGYRNFDKDEIVEIKKYEPDKCVTDETIDNKLEDPPEKPQLKLSQCELDEIKQLQSEYRLIGDYSAYFYSAISQLKTCTKIGIHGKDVSQGRLKRASVLAVSCPSNIFVFDLQALGDDVLEKGLKEILESPKIIKIVHDCRKLSDCLKHKHLINLENVRDVEAEDVMVVYQERRMIRRHSRSLDYLYKVYLGVELGGCEENAESWDERPLSLDLLQGLVSFVSFLIPLQEEIERKYFQLLVDASNIYKNHLRDLEFFDLLYDEPKKTLRNEISKLLVPQNRVRSDYRTKKVLPSDTS